MNITTSSVISCLLVPLLATNAFADSGIEGLGDLPGGSSTSSARGISGDGTTVIGTSHDGNYRGFRWTAADGMVDLGSLEGGTGTTWALGVNNDGSAVVGHGSTATGSVAFLWTAAGGMEGLGDLAGGNFYSGANAVSDDGKTVVGYGSTAASGGYVEAMMWTAAGGMVSLGDFDGADRDSEAHDVSDDGSVVVGYGSRAAGDEAFRWTAGSGMVGLGFLAGGGDDSEAYAVSGDGLVVVGSGSSSHGYEAFRWSSEGGMVGLGDLPGGDFESGALGVNKDGSVVVGFAGVDQVDPESDEDATEAFRWTAATGMQSLTEWLADSGYVLSDWVNTTAFGVSDDGTVVVGDGTNADGDKEAFIARSGSGLIGLNDFSESLGGVASVVTQGMSSAQTILHGAHGHPGAKRDMDQQRIVWISGDLASDNHHNSSNDYGLGEAGISYKFTDRVMLSGALGMTWGDSTLVNNGSSSSDGYYLAVDADLRLSAELPLYATLSYVDGNSDVDIQRGYLNAGSLDQSNGSTQQHIQALRARLQWQSALQQSKLEMHPYIEYDLIDVETDAYTETDGGFPASFDANQQTVHDWRLGSDINYQLSSDRRFIGSLEGVHRQESQGSAVSGQVIGLSGFSFEGREYDQNWLRGTLGLEQQLGQGRLTLTFNASSEGEDPSYWGGLSYALGF